MIYESIIGVAKRDAKSLDNGSLQLVTSFTSCPETALTLNQDDSPPEDQWVAIKVGQVT